MHKCEKCGLPLDLGQKKGTNCPRCKAKFIIRDFYPENMRYADRKINIVQNKKKSVDCKSGPGKNNYPPECIDDYNTKQGIELKEKKEIIDRDIYERIRKKERDSYNKEINNSSGSMKGIILASLFFGIPFFLSFFSSLLQGIPLRDYFLGIPLLILAFLSLPLSIFILGIILTLIYIKKLDRKIEAKEKKSGTTSLTELEILWLKKPLWKKLL